ncbi:MAG: hypothetical protein HFJ54_00405 [Clostridia bacterium]|nr:hypothetical protein [Clostridia bacterium]
MNFGYGQIDKTANKEAFTQELETDHTYYTTREVREVFSKDNGTDNISEIKDEIERHEEYGCKDLSLHEADGDLSTGHIHEKAIIEVKAYDPDIAEVFTDDEIADRVQKMAEEHPDDSFEEVVDRAKKDLSDDAARMHHGPSGR